MNQLICFAALLTVAAAVPSGYYRTAGFAVPPATQGKYHAQDELGQYSFGYYQPGQARMETKDLGGITRGSYSYVAPNGRLITNNYVADENGFRSSLAPTDGNAGPLVARLPVQPVAVQPAVKYALPVAQRVSVVQPTVAVPAAVPVAHTVVAAVRQPNVYAAPAASPHVKTIYEPSVRYISTGSYGAYNYPAIPYANYAPGFVSHPVRIL